MSGVSKIVVGMAAGALFVSGLSIIMGRPITGVLMAVWYFLLSLLLILVAVLEPLR